MRVLFVALLLLAGCASPAPTSEPEAPVTPIHADPRGALPEPVEIDDSGDLVSGADKEWTWELDPRVLRMSIHMTGNGPQGVPVQMQNALEVSLYHNGTIVEEGGTRGMFGTVGGGTVSMFNYDEVASNGTLTNHAGTWVLKLSTGPNVAAYDLSIRATYRA